MKTLLCLVYILSFSTNAKTLNFLTANYCPLICESGDKKGVLVDILHQIYRPLGYKINIKYMPLKRAFLEFNNGNYDGFIGGNQIQLPKNKFPHYVSAPNSVFAFKLSNSKWKYTGINSLSKIKIGVVKNFSYEDKDIDNYLKINKLNKTKVLLININEHLKKLTSLLEKKRINIFLGGSIATEHYLNKYKLQKKIVPASKRLGVFKNYISFNSQRNNYKKLISIHDQRFKLLYDKGIITKIYKEYGIQSKIPLLINNYK
jgi:polar amino acid transport system substrate-binding protein